MTNDDIKNLKKSIEEQNNRIEEILCNNKIYLEKLEDILITNENILENILTEDDNEIVVGDHIIYYDYSVDNMLIGKIITNDYYNYQLFYPLSNECSTCCYESIEELVDDYSDNTDFEIIYTGEYSNNIPKKTFSYILIKDDGHEYEVFRLGLLENNGFCLYDKDTDDIIARKDTYDELIFHMIKNFQLIIPLRNN